MINRSHYINELENLIGQKKSQLIALYGRRRVGKTCLIRHCYQKNKIRYMEATGLQNGTMKQQLAISQLQD